MVDVVTVDFLEGKYLGFSAQRVRRLHDLWEHSPNEQEATLKHVSVELADGFDVACFGFGALSFLICQSHVAVVAHIRSKFSLRQVIRLQESQIIENGQAFLDISAKHLTKLLGLGATWQARKEEEQLYVLVSVLLKKLNVHLCCELERGIVVLYDSQRTVRIIASAHLILLRLFLLFHLLIHVGEHVK